MRRGAESRASTGLREGRGGKGGREGGGVSERSHLSKGARKEREGGKEGGKMTKTYLLCSFHQAGHVQVKKGGKDLPLGRGACSETGSAPLAAADREDNRRREGGRKRG